MVLKLVTKTNYERLLHVLREYKRAIIAYSGGVDSTFLLKSAIEALGRKNVVACIAESPTFPNAESVFAQDLCTQWGVSFCLIKTKEMQNKAFIQNTPDRCYHCKTELFGKILQHARKKGVKYVLEGSNADDRKDYRPGMRAVQELGIRSPLLDCDLSKAEIRALSRDLGIPTADKPSLACLSSRIPYGTKITEKVLQKVHDAEKIVRSFGIVQCRVRDHGDQARIEVVPADIAKLAGAKVRTAMCRKLKKIGYKYITLDLEGYRTGSMNLVLTKTDKEA
jgi:pyridinium-3,5-biscarboxylic acid mononucleotide sulfurtransferase